MRFRVRNAAVFIKAIPEFGGYYDLHFAGFAREQGKIPDVGQNVGAIARFFRMDMQSGFRTGIENPVPAFGAFLFQQFRLDLAV